MNTENKLKEYTDLMSDIYKNIWNYSDQELSDKLKLAYLKVPSNMDINDVKLNKILKIRVKKYCENNNIEMEEYNGCLPFRSYKIPVGGLSRKDAEQQIHQLMSEYNQDIQLDDNLGTININGSSHIPQNKDYWFPNNDNKDYWFPVKK